MIQTFNKTQHCLEEWEWITFHHEKLADREMREEIRQHWKNVLLKLNELIANHRS